MKKKNLLISASLALGIGVGVFAGIGLHNGVAEVNEVKAAGETTTIYLDLNQTNWYGKENRQIKVSYWGGSSEAAFPGVNMVEDAFHLFHVDIPSDTTGLLFNVNGWSGDCQTVDLTFNSLKTMWTLTSKNTNGTNQTASCEAFSPSKTIYVLDKTGDLLTNEGAHVHCWRNDSSVVKSDWTDESHGIALSNVSGNIYSATIPGVMTSLLFNNNDASQTADLSVDGECSVLEGNWDGSNWNTLESAQFVDENMRFASIDESNGTKGTACKSFYSSVRTAYDNLPSNEARLEVLGVNGVSERLGEWASANGDSLDTVTGGKLSPARIIANGTISKESSNFVVITVTAASIALLGTAGFFLLRRRKEN